MRSQPQQVEKAEQEVAHKPSVHCFEGVQRRFAARHRGFSLIEILVVVSNSLLPLTPGPVLVSAGPDKEFGTDDDIHTEQI